MTGDASNSPKALPAVPESVPLAVEFLINLILRWTCFAMGGAFGLLAMVAWFQEWTWWIMMPSLAMTLGTFVCAVLISPKGKLKFDSRGPMVILQAANSVDPCPTNEQSHQA